MSGPTLLIERLLWWIADKPERAAFRLKERRGATWTGRSRREVRRMRGKSRLKPHRYRAGRISELIRQVEALQGERQRLEVLLAEALRYAGHHTGCSPWTLLQVFAERHRTRLDRPAWMEARDRNRLERLLEKLSDTRATA